MLKALRKFYVGSRPPRPASNPSVTPRSLRKWLLVWNSHERNCDSKAKVFAGFFFAFIAINGGLLAAWGFVGDDQEMKYMICAAGVAAATIHLIFVSFQHQIRYELEQRRDAALVALGMPVPSDDIPLLRGVTTGIMVFATVVGLGWISVLLVCV